MIDHYESGVLKPELHGRLVENIDAYAKDAFITVDWISSRLTDYCGEPEIEWLRRFKFHHQEKCYGLCLTGDSSTVIDRMSAMAGGLLRNFIRARVMTLHTILSDDAPDLTGTTALLVPNFYLTKGGGANIPQWKIGELQDLLMNRRLQGLMTIVYVEDMAKMGNDYGVHTRKFVEANYTVLKIIGD